MGERGAPRAVIFGCSGPVLGDGERLFFRDADPLGFILFARNCRDPDQVRGAVQEVIEELGAATIKDMGRVMAAIKERYPGRMEFGKASALVKERLA